MRLSCVKGFSTAALSAWAAKHLEPGSTVVCDGLACFAAVTTVGCVHHPIATGGGRASVELTAFTWVNTMLGNLKRSLDGTYHAVSAKHLPRYLAEFCYRFSRRFDLRQLISRARVRGDAHPADAGSPAQDG